MLENVTICDKCHFLSSKNFGKCMKRTFHSTANSYKKDSKGTEKVSNIGPKLRSTFKKALVTKISVLNTIKIKKNKCF